MTIVPPSIERARLGTPIPRKALTIVPIHLEPTTPALDYMPLSEAIRTGRAELTEISEGGSVPLLAVRNKADVALFILDGEELVGAKQNRVVNLSILVPAKSVLPIPVSCVERGRWSYRTRGFDVSPNVLFAAGRAPQMAAVTMCLSASGRRDGNQSRVWHDVDKRVRDFGVGSPTAAMRDVYADRHAQIEEMLAGLQPTTDQVGAVFAVGGRVVGMELFETPAIFAQYFNKVARSYALDALVANADAEFAAIEAELLLADVKVAHLSRFKAVGLGDDIRISDPRVVGGALVLGDRLVHLAAFRNIPEDTEPTMHRHPETSQARSEAPVRPDVWTRIKRWFSA